MRADERQAGAAYTYAWWLTGDDDAAVGAIRAAFGRLAEAGEGDGPPLTVLMRGVRAHVGDLRPMCPASELALLHDGLDVELGAAAELAGVPSDDVTVALAHGRLEGLLETVREDFEHPERLGGLAVGNPADIAHARQCPSCARGRTLLERGRNELREVVAVSAPAGLLAELAGEAPTAAPAPAEAAVAEEHVPEPVAASATQELAEQVEPVAPPAQDVTQDVAIDLTEDEAPGDVASVDENVIDDVAVEDIHEPVNFDEAAAPAPGEAPDQVDELAPPSGEELMQRPALLRPEPQVRKVPTTPARRRTVAVLAGLGLLVVFALVTTLFAMGSQRTPSPQAEQPAIDQPTAGSTPDGAAPGTEAPGFGPDGEGSSGFTVTDAGLLRSGEEEFAQPGGEVDADEPLRLAVDYRNAVEGVTVNAVWRVDGERYLRLRAVLAGSSSRHVWGLPVPPDGWPVGAHRVLITTDDGLAAAVDFHVRE
jgi:hypothetical protein